LLELVLV